MRDQQPQPGLDALAPFFRRVGSAMSRGLLLDFDGTIAPIVVDRSLAAPYPGVRSRLRALVLAPRPTRVAIVSGRALGDLRARAAIEAPLELWGSHGLERLRADGRELSEPPPARVGRLLEEIAAAFDLTDEDAFAALGDRGLSVLVRATPHPTRAHAWIRPPEEVFQFLAAWTAASEGQAA